MQEQKIFLPLSLPSNTIAFMLQVRKYLAELSGDVVQTFMHVEMALVTIFISESHNAPARCNSESKMGTNLLRDQKIPKLFLCSKSENPCPHH